MGIFVETLVRSVELVVVGGVGDMDFPRIDADDGTSICYSVWGKTLNEQ